MSLRKNLLIVSCVVVALFGVLQVQANAGLVASWGLDESPNGFTVSTSVAAPHTGNTGTLCADSSGNGYDLMYGSASTPGTNAFTSVTLGTGASVPPPIRGDKAITTNGNGVVLSWLNYTSGIGPGGGGLAYPLTVTGSTGYTIEFFFNTASTAFQHLYSEDAGTTPRLGIYLNNNSTDNGGLALCLSTNSGGAAMLGNVYAPVTIATNTWYFGALVATAGGGYTTYVYDYATSQLYTSATKTGLGAVSPAPIWAQLFTNAANYAGGVSKFNGTMDNVKIYNSPLLTDDLIAHATTPVPEPGTLALLAAGLAGLLCYAWRKRR